MINENQDDVMNAYSAVLGGQSINEAAESDKQDDKYEEALTNAVTAETDSILEAYMASNQAVANKEKAILQEKYDKMKETDKKEDEEEKPLEEEVCEKCGQEGCVCEEEKLDESEFQKFLKKRLAEREDNETMSQEEMLKFFAESEILWEEEKDDEVIEEKKKMKKENEDSDYSDEDEDDSESEDDEDDSDKEKLDEAEDKDTYDDINNDEEFMEYGEKLLKTAHGDEYDAKKGKETLKGMLKTADGDYGKAIGILQASLD
jgi:hypothetical protein